MMYKEDKTMREDYKAAKKLADDAVKEAKKNVFHNGLSWQKPYKG